MMRNFKTKAALGEIPLEMLSDMGSIPIISTMNTKRGSEMTLFFCVHNEVGNRKILMRIFPKNTKCDLPENATA